MRIRTASLIGALLTAWPAIAAGQQAPTPTQAPAAPSAAQAVPAPGVPPPLDVTVGRVAFGFRGESVSGDSARFNRYRDLRDGAVLDQFRLSKDTERWSFLGTASNVGYRDQRFTGDFNSIGRLKVGFTWDQIPLFVSRDTYSLQPAGSTGVLGVDDSIQAAIQQGTLTLSNAMPSATRFDMRSRRDVAALDLTYAANRDVDFVLEVRNTNREGAHLQSFSVGSSPGNGIAQELGVPTETRTTDVKAIVEYASKRGMASAGVNASWFDNRIPTVQFDNPLRLTDISGGPSKGLAVMWPSNSLVSFVANGAYKLPAKTRATAALSFGRADQNEALAPPTINTALVAPPLERATAEAQADVISMVYAVNSRPIEHVWLNARYRYYDYANKTPIFDTYALVGDWALSTTEWETEPLSIERQTIDLDASFTPHEYIAFGTGYSREASDRTFRIYERTDEDIFRATIDSTASSYVTLRLKYEYSRREGSGFDPHLLEEVSEQPATRHYDVADRERSRVTGQLTLAPLSWLSLNGSASTGHDDYQNSGFGLRDNKNNTYSVGFEIVPASTVAFGVSYDREKYTANQYSRTANPPPNPQFDDPTRDWWIDSNDTVSTVSATADFLKAIPRTDIRLSYDYTDGKATYVYGLAPGSTVFVPPASLQQIQPLKNRLTDARADFQYYIRSNVAIGAVYWFEEYRVFDFSLNPETINTLNIGTSTVYSGYLYQPYTAHTGWLKISYLW